LTTPEVLEDVVKPRVVDLIKRLVRRRNPLGQELLEVLKIKRSL
jgi:hypothetical protein